MRQENKAISGKKFYSPIRAFLIDLLSSFSAEMKTRIEIFTLKLDCGENFMLFGHSGHALQRFEDFVFTIHLYGIFSCSDNIITAALNFIQMYSKY